MEVTEFIELNLPFDKLRVGIQTATNSCFLRLYSGIYSFIETGFFGEYFFLSEETCRSQSDKFPSENPKMENNIVV